MKIVFSRFRRLYQLVGAVGLLAVLFIAACNSDKPTRFDTTSLPPKFFAKLEVVLGDNDSPSKSEYTAGTMGSAPNFKYKVEIETKYTASDPFGAARAYAVVDGDTIFISSQDWVSSPGSNHAVSLFAFASRGTGPGNPASALVKVQCQWD